MKIEVSQRSTVQKRKREREEGKTRESRGEKEQRRYVFHESEAKLRSCGDIAEIFKVVKRKKTESFENCVERMWRRCACMEELKYRRSE